jgi:hypothetical protein
MNMRERIFKITYDAPLLHNPLEIKCGQTKRRERRAKERKTK